MSADELTGASLVEVTDAIARKRVSSVEVTAACLERIERWRPRLEAFVSLDAEGAIAQARDADAALARGELRGPLHGVPQLIGRPYSEALLFNLGHAYQGVTDWHHRAPTPDRGHAGPRCATA